MKTKIIMGVLGVLLIGGLYWGLTSSKQAKLTSTDKPLVKVGEVATTEKDAPLIDEQGGIQVSVKWEKQEGASIQKFSVNLNNHGVNVDNFDFPKNVQVLLNNKEITAQVKVINQMGAGHHSGVELQIESPELAKVTEGSSLTLNIKNVFDTPTRSFTWKV